jgi:UDP-glucose 4-epimerase
VHMSDRRPGDPAALVAGADRIREVLGWVPRRNNLDTIVEDALSWEKRLRECRAAS